MAGTWLVATPAVILASRTGQSTPSSGERAGYTGPMAAQAAAAHGLKLEVIKLSLARRGFVLLPRRWLVERFFGWAARFASSLAGLHGLAFACLRLRSFLDASSRQPLAAIRRLDGGN